MAPCATSKAIFRAFKLHGLAIRSDALHRLDNELNREPSLHVDDVIYAIKNSLDRKQLSTVITVDTIDQALETLLQVTEENNYQQIQVFNAFDIPQLKCVPSKNAYEVLYPTRTLRGTAEDRIELASNRYVFKLFLLIPRPFIRLFRFTLIEQRVRRNKLFSPPLLDDCTSSRYIQASCCETMNCRNEALMK